MRTLYCWIFTLSLSGFVLSACHDVGVELSEDEALALRTGSISFSLIKSSMPTDVFWVVVRLEHVDFPVILDSVNVAAAADAAQLYIKYIQPGVWTLIVSAKDSLGIERYKGTTSVVIERGRTAVADIALDPLFGSLEIHVTWPGVVGDWEIYANNPVLRQTPGGFDSDYFFFHDPKVLKINGIYRMWYTTGYNVFVQGIDRSWIAYATSTDGVNWIKHGPVLHPGPLGSWNEKGVALSAVLYDNGIYKIWFSGNSATTYGTGIGYAESADGVLWNISPQLVIVGNSSKPELRYPEVIKKDDIYYLYYNYGTLASGSLEVYLLTSSDGIQWTDRGKVLSKRNNVTWETRGVAAPAVLFEQNKFRMYYTGLGINDEAIGYAESVDGVHWTTRSVQPIIIPSQASPWGITYASHPTILRDGGILKMWFSGLSQVPFRWEIGYAERH